jgi:hypothetical protein
MVSPTVVLKCRECGATHPLGYAQSIHQKRDHCDGSLHPYCSACKQFCSLPSCSDCTKREDEKVELARQRRRAAIVRWRAYPFISQLDWLLRRNATCRQILEDWESYAALRPGHKTLAICTCVGFLTGTLIPSSLRVFVFICVGAVTAYVWALKTLPDEESRI